MAGRSVTDYESVTVAGTSIGFDATAATNNGIKPSAATITVETAQLRFRTDGTAPTSSEGHLAGVGDVIELTDRGECDNFRAIRTGATSGVIKVTKFVEWAS